ncbi:MAG: RNA polymerase factor sigma-32 [Proteobacteria bacterium]|nr:RNA polymerase factor sigma-32 [Pseudomonadota bacterium]
MPDKRNKSNLPAVVSGNKLPASQSPLQAYLREVNRYPLLTPEEEYDLAISHFDQQDREAAQRLITSNLRLVVKIANEFRTGSTSVLDLIQEGNYGLMQAVKKFNPYKGVKLSSYAAWWIRAFILKFLMDAKSQVRIATTAAQRKLFYNLRRETDKLLQQYETADPKLLAAAMNVREKDVLDMQMRMQGGDVSLDAPVGDDGTLRSETMGLEDHEERVDDQIAHGELMNIFEDQLIAFKATLKDRDLDIFNDRLLAENPLTLQEIGDRYKITRERARQIEARIMKALKDFVKKDRSISELMPDAKQVDIQI